MCQVTFHEPHVLKLHIFGKWCCDEWHDHINMNRYVWTYLGSWQQHPPFQMPLFSPTLHILICNSMFPSLTTGQKNIGIYCHAASKTVFHNCSAKEKVEFSLGWTFYDFLLLSLSLCVCVCVCVCVCEEGGWLVKSPHPLPLFKTC